MNNTTKLKPPSFIKLLLIGLLISFGIAMFLTTFLDVDYDFIVLTIVVESFMMVYAYYLDYKFAKWEAKQIYDRLDDGLDLDIDVIETDEGLTDLISDNHDKVKGEIEQLEVEQFMTEEDDEYDLEDFNYGLWEEVTEHPNSTFLEMINVIDGSNFVSVEPNPEHGFFESRCRTEVPLGVLTYQFDSNYYIFVEHNTLDIRGKETTCGINTLACIRLPYEHAQIIMEYKQESENRGEKSDEYPGVSLRNYHFEPLRSFDQRPFPKPEVLELLDHMQFKHIEFYENWLILNCFDNRPVEQARFLIKYMPKIVSLYHNKQ